MTSRSGAWDGRLDPDRDRSRLVAILGPTNTGKTHLAVERMLGFASGMIGLPLRLLAREIYDRVVKARGAGVVALITGEEKIIPPRPRYFVCTVEAMPLDREVEFLAVDEIQLCADPERGHVFTQRLLHARGTFETLFLGSGAMVAAPRNMVSNWPRAPSSRWVNTWPRSGSAQSWISSTARNSTSRASGIASTVQTK